MLRSTRRHNTLVLEVADTGRGISAADKEKIFLPYFSTKGRGSGLGLSIVHRMVTDHHATLQVSRQPAARLDFQHRGAVR